MIQYKVEDYLAKYIVDEYIKKMELNRSRLISILPVGGWENVLTLQNEIYVNNTFGVGTKVYSVLDGDVEELALKQYKTYPKLFLPIKSLEKYLYDVLIAKSDNIVKKEINDMFFSVESIDELLAAYYRGESRNDNNGKTLYKRILKSLEARRISEEVFVRDLAKIIMKNHDFSLFEKRLKEALE